MVKFGLSDLFGLNVFFAVLAFIFASAEGGAIGVVIFLHLAALLIPFAVGVFGAVAGTPNAEQLEWQFRPAVDFALRFALYCQVSVGLFWLYVLFAAALNVLWLDGS